MTRLESSLAYQQASRELIDEISNGCGPGGWKFDVVPDNLLGVDISRACEIHDWDYADGTLDRHRNEADKRFLRNMRKLVRAAGGPRHLRWARLCLAWWYYRGVHKLGAAAFTRRQGI